MPICRRVSDFQHDSQNHWNRQRLMGWNKENRQCRLLGFHINLQGACRSMESSEACKMFVRMFKMFTLQLWPNITPCVHNQRENQDVIMVTCPNIHCFNKSMTNGRLAALAGFSVQTTSYQISRNSRVQRYWSSSSIHTTINHQCHWKYHNDIFIKWNISVPAKTFHTISFYRRKAKCCFYQAWL